MNLRPRLARALAALPAVSLLVALALAALPALAQLPELPLGKWWKRPRIVEQLKLTADQQQRLEEIWAKNRRSFVDLRADLERRQIDLEELLAQKDADPKKIGAAAEALEQAKARAGKARTMMVVEMRGVLTAEQWQKIVEARDQWRRERLDDRRRNLPPGARRGEAPPAEPE